MTPSASSSSPEGSSPEGSSPESSSPDQSAKTGGAPGGPGSAGGGDPGGPVTSEEWSRLRAPFSQEAYVTVGRATGRTAENLAGRDNSEQAVVDLHPRPRAIRDRLDLVLGPGRYSYRMEAGPEGASAGYSSGPCSMFCHLRIGGVARTGSGTGSRLGVAGAVALARAAAAFGIGASGQVTGPVVVQQNAPTRGPIQIREILEQRDEPSLWAPKETSEEKGVSG